MAAAARPSASRPETSVVDREMGSVTFVKNGGRVADNTPCDEGMNGMDAQILFLKKSTFKPEYLI